MQTRTSCLRGLGNAQAIAQRVEVPRCGVAQTGHILVACNVLAQFSTFDPMHLVAMVLLHVGLFLAQCPGFARAVGNGQVRPHRLAIDVEALDALLHQLHTGQGELPQLLARSQTQVGIQPSLATGIATDGLPAIAPRGVSTQTFGFEEDDALATFSQFECGGQTRQATADHHHISLAVLLQTRPSGPVHGGLVKAVLSQVKVDGGEIHGESFKLQFASAVLDRSSRPRPRCKPPSC
jgi:hypothetical protein